MNRNREAPFINRLFTQFPSLDAIRAEHLRDNFGEMLPYLLLGDVARQAIRWHEEGVQDTDKELSRLLRFLEREYIEGDDAVQQLIEQGFLENLAGPPEPYWRIRERCGPTLRSRIEEMWPSTGFPQSSRG